MPAWLRLCNIAFDSSLVTRLAGYLGSAKLPRRSRRWRLGFSARRHCRCELPRIRWNTKVMSHEVVRSVESEICFQDGSCKRRRWHQNVSRKVPGTCFVLPASALSPNRPLLTEDPCCAWCLGVGVTGWRPWKWESGPRSAAPLHPIPQWGSPHP
jgi:hypothetical protein